MQEQGPYKIILAKDIQSLADKINEAAKQGYRVSGGITFWNTNINIPEQFFSVLMVK